MRLRKPVKRWKVIAAATSFFVLFFIVQTFLFIEYNLRPVFAQVAESYARKIATEAINDAISKKVAEEIDYTEIVIFYKDNQGNIRSAVFNLNEANRIKSQATLRVQEVLNEINAKNLLKVKLPIGQAFHSTILAAMGPTVPVTMIPIGTVISDIKERSETLGINQTKHMLTLDIDVQVNIIIPLVSKTTELHSQIPVASFVVIGEVPQFFYDSAGNPFVPPGTPTPMYPISPNNGK
jgi:sporulation protein YunB